MGLPRDYDRCDPNPLSRLRFGTLRYVRLYGRTEPPNAIWTKRPSGKIHHCILVQSLCILRGHDRDGDRRPHWESAEIPGRGGPAEPILLEPEFVISFSFASSFDNAPSVRSQSTASEIDLPPPIHKHHRFILLHVNHQHSIRAPIMGSLSDAIIIRVLRPQLLI